MKKNMELLLFFFFIWCVYVYHFSDKLNKFSDSILYDANGYSWVATQFRFTCVYL